MINLKISYENSLVAKLAEIQTSIEDASKKGRFKIEIQELNKEIQNILKNEGYSVGWISPHFEISWNK